MGAANSINSSKETTKLPKPAEPATSFRCILGFPQGLLPVGQALKTSPGRHPVGILVRCITRIQKSLHLVMMKGSVCLCDARRYIVRGNLPLEGSPKQNCFWVRGQTRAIQKTPMKGRTRDLFILPRVELPWSHPVTRKSYMHPAPHTPTTYRRGSLIPHRDTEHCHLFGGGMYTSSSCEPEAQASD